MRIWFNNVVDTQRRVLEVQGNRVRIGRAPENDLVLHSPYIADEALVLSQTRDGWELLVLGMNGVKIGDEQLATGARRTIDKSLSLELFPYTLTVDLPHAEQVAESIELQQQDEEMSTLIARVHRELLERMDLKRGVDRNKQNDDGYLLTLERHLESIAESQLESSGRAERLQNHIAGHALRDQLLQAFSNGEEADAGDPSSVELLEKRHWSRIVTAVPERENEMETTAKYIEKLIDLDPLLTVASERMEAIGERYWKAWGQVRSKVHHDFKRYLTLRHLKKEIKDIVFGYGPLEDLLRMPSVTEIMVVDRERIYVEIGGVIKNSGRRFISDEIVESIIQRIVGKVGRRIDKSQPLVDARLRDGSRVNAVIPPLAVNGPALTIRKFPERQITISNLIALGSFSETIANFLRTLVLARRNIIVSGGTGTGKTTLLNCLSDFIPDRERIVTVEDTAELQLTKQHVVRLETKVANVEGAGEYTIRDLVRNALRMRPDRIVVGECRGAEALDMLQSMNTGHDGSLTTVHANDAHDVPMRLEVLVQMAADLPITSIHRQIGSAIDIIIQLQRMRDGRRIVSQITECVGVNAVTGKLQLRDLYLLDESQTLQPTGQLPSFVGELLQGGMLDLETFYQ
ncbi:ATPase, T2SS/T4P/T4SS family [Aureliella helgolandensis]|uniref:Conjugal transfer protein n=1 Tax=Aureliella helgolandensis TaxID=2527968 RepID=A0A518G142_9BACT|nr:ATPase, T2SS/T4P/T4SS family [Aureliella helgolandensis]QDV22322.1 Putative conjugal transfer protein [Aureliella helgolandensis]